MAYSAITDADPTEFARAPPDRAPEMLGTGGINLGVSYGFFDSNCAPSPLFFISVASKRLRVSCKWFRISTFVGAHVSVDFKGS
jgi:hypothetical protein